jgi:hypothetical protein
MRLLLRLDLDGYAFDRDSNTGAAERAIRIVREFDGAGMTGPIAG